METCMRCGQPFAFEPFKFLCDACIEYNRLCDEAEINARRAEIEQRQAETARLRAWESWARAGEYN
jgi:hypothetical protein